METSYTAGSGTTTNKDDQTAIDPRANAASRAYHIFIVEPKTAAKCLFGSSNAILGITYSTRVPLDV